MIKRTLQDAVENSLERFPVVGLIGPRQTGKTTLAKTILQTVKRKTTYLDLELPSDMNKLQEAELYLKSIGDNLVIIDEVQRMPSLFPLLRALVDQKRHAGRFLILGSASPDLIRHSSESLAGRIIYHELTPFTLQETGYDAAKLLWLRGGYPQSYLAGNDDDSFTWRESFIKNYLEMDIPQLAIHVPAVQLRRFWTMLAHVHGNLWNASQIANSLGVSAPTVKRYMDILEDTFIARQLQPYHVNVGKRLVKSPKVYVRDSGLVNALLRINSMDDIHSTPSLGSLWEGFIVEQIICMLPAGWTSYFYRTSAGAEIDLLLIDKKGRPVAVEIKFSSSPKVARGLQNAMEDLACKKAFVIYPGDEAYPMSKNVHALPVGKLPMIFAG
jgi:predicted AAA+ superfamily ATPase